MRQFLTRLVEVTFVLGLVWICLNCTGCNTMHGIGSDMQDMSSAYVERSR